MIDVRQTPAPNRCRQPLQLWGGIECTVNRVGESYRDQIVLSGHQERSEDLELFAALNMRALRYPVLWERTAPTPLCEPDWSWPDARLGLLRSLTIRPIVGLVHHGSGPLHTNLLADSFAVGLGHFAGLVAARYPWIDDWTPVNEPLTTARFSALYGHWYPHHRDERSFWLALINQVDAVRMAMRAIRRVNPAARLIQTDDLGRTYSTVEVSKQAEYDNLRRWASWDLLFGRVDRSHPLADIFERMGFGDRIRRIADDPCPPNIVGLNHYLTSDRFLDHRIERYPSHLRGGNGEVAYADTEAVRVMDPAAGGLSAALQEAWSRYGTTIALTEVHNGCTVDEQMRWAADAWDAAQDARGGGVDVCAVTAWSLLGSQGWNTLLTNHGDYETGVFDVSSGHAATTALATLWQALSLGSERHPVAREKGWWRRPDRLLYPLHPLGPSLKIQSSLCAGATLLIRDAPSIHVATFVEVCTARGICHSLERSAHESGNQSEKPLGSLASVPPWGVVEISRDDAKWDNSSVGEAWLITISSSMKNDASSADHSLGPPVASVLPGKYGPTPAVVGRVIDLLIEGEEGRWVVTDQRTVAWTESGSS